MNKEQDRQEEKREEQQPQEVRDEQQSAGEQTQPSDDKTQQLSDLSLKEQLEAAVAERDANYERWLRARAELDNFRKRMQREAEELRKYQAFQLIRDLLPVLDNLERAIAAAEGTSSKPAEALKQLTEGLRMVQQQFLDVLARYGAKPIEALHQTFDPSLHEAVSQVPSKEHPPMTVVHEVERGYVLHDRVVRPTKVVVSMAAEDQQQTTDSQAEQTEEQQKQEQE